MAIFDDDEGDDSGGMSGALSRQAGPLKIYQWLGFGGAAAYLIYRFMKSRGMVGTAAGTSASTSPTQFTSSQDTSTTDPTTGNTTTSSFSASGDSFLPGEITTSAQPMPFSAGDIYVNVAGQGATPPAQNVPAAPSPITNVQMPHVRSAQGVDVGEYRFGADQLQYLQSHIGTFGITQPTVNEVTSYYNNIAANYGTDVADNYHYADDNHQVTAIPEFVGAGGAVVYPKSTSTSATSGPSNVFNGSGLPGTNVPANPNNPSPTPVTVQTANPPTATTATGKQANTTGA
jgi:hypothetical protein